jgi:hypothetical protein
MEEIKYRPTITELEALLQEEDRKVEILPDGTVRMSTNNKKAKIVDIFRKFFKWKK